MAFHVGMKVVCIVEIEVEMLSGGSYPGPIPLLGKVYTVADFVDNEGVAEAFGSESCTAAILLREVPTARARASKRPIGWPIVCFRPVIERKTDISIFTAMLTDKREPAHA